MWTSFLTFHSANRYHCYFYMTLEVALESIYSTIVWGTYFDPDHCRPRDVDLGIKSCVCTSLTRNAHSSNLVSSIVVARLVVVMALTDPVLFAVTI